ncbi:ABC transporter permease subunit [Rhodovibrio salinarum]|uniref:ABC transporter permease n=1 Tax=Rhodovibrio salinarum TaxID=1087 RepID=A0A934QMK8_9PROT|nr:ABC transporter permease subunit [Rhodovibrio salinarum]MBK1699075.1 ABC transporter permease [Rhodovibrio salinarum]
MRGHAETPATPGAAVVTLTLAKRELAAYFASPLAYVFITAFLVLSALLTFQLGGFFARGQADLLPFFRFHPWLYLILVPAVGMRLWAEERRNGTLELLLSLPVTTGQLVVAKFAAGWAFLGLALALTAPMWLAVSYLGAPDHGAILAGYLGSWLMAGGYLAVAACLSAATQNQVVAFVLALAACFALLAGGSEVGQGFLSEVLPTGLADALAQMSVLSRFDDFQQGVVAFTDVVFFASLITCALVANTALVELKRDA